ncbi:MAG: ICC-like phosphoesterase [Bacteroidota bacterium]|nr:ICC-like phosphoesterase [Bacteroidota bacterium]
MKLLLQDQALELLAEKSLYHPDTRTLVIADLHLGKTTHFRKSGIALPAQSTEKDYLRIEALIEKLQPEEIIFLGDLFHSSHNSEWEIFLERIKPFSHIHFTLILGNHDILPEKHYIKSGFTIVKNKLEIGNIIYSHKPLLKIPADKLNIAGHIHPGYILSGKAHHNIRLPCFYYHRNCLIMPAFGSLTGLYLMEEIQTAKVFLIVKDKVIRL